jgi:hypothetical protein
MKFIEDVVSGNLILGNYARLAVQRHLNDLKNKKWDYVYSESHANRAFGERFGVNIIPFFIF